jgi:hypothetical protein
MVKFSLGLAAILVSLTVADLAEARHGRRGCASCGVVSSCPGGVCAAPAAPGKYGVYQAAPAAVVATPAPAAEAPVAVAPAPAPRYYTATNVRRGIFGWRR